MTRILQIQTLMTTVNMSIVELQLDHHFTHIQLLPITHATNVQTPQTHNTVFTLVGQLQLNTITNTHQHLFQCIRHLQSQARAETASQEISIVGPAATLQSRSILPHLHQRQRPVLRRQLGLGLGLQQPHGHPPPLGVVMAVKVTTVIRHAGTQLQALQLAWQQ